MSDATALRGAIARALTTAGPELLRRVLLLGVPDPTANGAAKPAERATEPLKNSGTTTLASVVRPQVEALVAEKTEAMVRFGAVNTRFKDYFDPNVPSTELTIDPGTLSRQLAETFEAAELLFRRVSRSHSPTTLPAILSETLAGPSARAQVAAGPKSHVRATKAARDALGRRAYPERRPGSVLPAAPAAWAPSRHFASDLAANGTACTAQPVSRAA